MIGQWNLGTPVRFLCLCPPCCWCSPGIAAWYALGQTARCESLATRPLVRARRAPVSSRGSSSGPTRIEAGAAQPEQARTTRSPRGNPRWLPACAQPGLHTMACTRMQACRSYPTENIRWCQQRSRYSSSMITCCLPGRLAPWNPASHELREPPREERGAHTQAWRTTRT